MSEHSNREREIFGEALELGSLEEQRAFVKGACGNDETLRQSVEALLEAYSQASGFIPERTATPSDAPGQRVFAEGVGSFIGRYKLLEKIGEGGCGVVYVAEQQEPVRRRVALKVIKLGMDTRQVVARFEAERQALALMDHPNIARVLDAGATETGRPFFVMELVRGIKITVYCDQHQLSTQERLDLFIQVCRAVQHAHQKGIIHRDLKPSNILVTINDGVAVPKIIDFGIAKATEGRLGDKTVYTELHQFIGTPAYMSPEQAEMTSVDIDTRSDIYSLGVLLYELLTARTPFEHQELMKVGLEAMRLTIRSKEPQRPSTRLSALAAADLSTVAKARRSEPPKLIHLVRGDLDWIVMKCLQKERAKRYESASGLARDLERHLHNEPVLARPPSRIYEVQKTVRRHWVGFVATAGIVVVLAFGATVSTLEAIRAVKAERDQIGQRRAAQLAQRNEARQRELAERLLYASKMKLVQQLWEQNDVGRARRALEEAAGYSEHGFEWYYWQRQMHREVRTLSGHLDGLSSVVFSRDGRWLATSSRDQTATVWDRTTGQERVRIRGHLENVNCVDFSPDGRRIVTGSHDHSARIWDTSTGRPLMELRLHRNAINSVMFSPDGRHIATGGADQLVVIWNASTGTNLLVLRGHTNTVSSVAFSPDSRRLVSGGDDGNAFVWDLLTGERLFALQGHGEMFHTVCYSGDGQRILTAGRNKAARVWDALTGQELLRLEGHQMMVNSAKFSPNGQRIVTGSDDQTAKVWDALSGRELFTLKGHGGGIECVAFSPDGQFIATASDDQTAKIWAAQEEPRLDLEAHTERIPDSVFLAAAFSPDGGRILAGSWDRTARLWDAFSGKELLMLTNHSEPVGSVAFSPDGLKILTGGFEGTTRVWEASTGKELVSLPGQGAELVSATFAPDGHRIATGGGDHTAWIWDSATGRALVRLKGHRSGVLQVAFFPDGQRLVTGSADQDARVWDSASGQTLLVLKGHTGLNEHAGWIWAVAVSPDGARIATGCDNGVATVWEAATGRELFVLKGHTDGIQALAFSPDGRRILSGSRDHTAKLWDAVSGEELLTLPADVETIRGVSFSPHGDRILTAGKTVKVWDRATAEQVATWQQEESEALRAVAAHRQEKEAIARKEQARQAVDPGAIKQWLLLWPIPYAGKNGAKALEQAQILDEGNLHPWAAEHARVNNPYDDGERVWQQVDLPTDLIDFNDLLYFRGEWSVAYAVSYIESSEAQTNLCLKIGSDDQSKVYLNGKQIYRCDEARTYVPDEDVVTGVELKAGLNVLVFKVVNEASNWKGSIHLTDAGGQPAKGVRTTLPPPQEERFSLKR